MSEFDLKQNLIHSLLETNHLDALVLNRVSSFAWATCGAPSYVNTAASDGVATLVITSNKNYLISNNIEGPRLEQEEGLAAQGWEFRTTRWYEATDLVAGLTRGMRIGADAPLPGMVDLSTQMARLRSGLTPEEGERFRRLGALCAESMQAVMMSIQPGQREYQIGARLAFETESRGIQPIAIMVATDARIFAYRHPIPKDKALQRYAMVILCGRKWGLVCSLTRLVHFGRLPEELRCKAEAVARIDAAFLAATRPGKTMGEVFECGQAAYAVAGYPEEWQRHHQGGSAGYEPREFVAVPGSKEIIRAGQAFAWNPSIQGAKSEDTFLVGETQNEVLTLVSGWPTLAVTIDGKTFERPAILEV